VKPLAEVKKAIADKTATIIDCVSSETFADGHITGALNNKAGDVVSKLPADKCALVVCYCEDDKSASWKVGTVKLTKLGYTNIKLYEGGIIGWKNAGGTLEK
jgi:rhodanese-related sulfurtransferase